MDFICLDLEGVLVPEIWISVAERTGIEALRATTRDIPDYRQLMDQRLKILDRHGLAIGDIQEVIGALTPLAGAADFLEALRARYQVVILSDTFYEFAAPLMRQLKSPTLLCHRLEIDDDGRIGGYRLRMADHKRQAVRAFKNLNFHVMAAGDSYNDTSMLIEADRGFLFRPPENVINEFPQFPVLREYDELLAAFDEAALK